MIKPLMWVGSARRDLKLLPDPVRHDFGYALFLAQSGRSHSQAKSLRSFRSAGVMEVVGNWQGNTYRAVYTVRFEAAVFVLHVFQKKSKSGIATPKRDMDLVRARLKTAEELVKEWSGETKEG